MPSWFVRLLPFFVALSACSAGSDRNGFAGSDGGAAGTTGAGGTTGAAGNGGSTGIAGTGQGGDAAPLPPEPIRINEPGGVAFDAKGRLLIADEYVSSRPGKIVAIDLAADTGTIVSRVDLYPGQIVSDGSNVYLTTGTVGPGITRMSIATGALTHIAGSPDGLQDFMDGTGPAALFNGAGGLALDGKGAIYVADAGNQVIRKVVLATGVVTTVAGYPRQAGWSEGTGEEAHFKGATDVAYDATTGALYVADLGNCSLRRVDVSTGAVSTLAGDHSSCGIKDGTGKGAGFDLVAALALDGKGNLYAGDTATIRKVVLATGEVTTIAGTPGAAVVRDGPPGTGKIFQIGAMVADGKGGLYFTELWTVRRLDLATGELRTLYGGDLTITPATR
ncbi:MAG TPA: hypothetical protein VHK47_14115 [Polyangia bacterium]|nr:hypothetical protein [Polyangia bacterium]